MTTTQLLQMADSGEQLTRDQQARLTGQLWASWSTSNGVRSFGLTDRGRTVLALRTGR